MGNQQRSPEQGNVQRLSRQGVGCERSRSGRHPRATQDEDIVRASPKGEGVFRSRWSSGGRRPARFRDPRRTQRKVTIGNNIRRSSDIIDENTTLRQALEANEIDYTVGMTSLDGVTLKAGDLDKTFAEMGITEKCYLLNVVKADNAAVIKVTGSAMVVESDAKLADIKKLAKYRPDALKLFKGEGNGKELIFKVGAAAQGAGTINQYGASFGVNTTADGKATITAMIPDGVSDPKAWVMDQVGVAILNLNKVEAQFAAAIADIDAEIAAINENIAVL